MRDEYRADLLQVNKLLVWMADAVRAAMSRATSGLLNADQTEAEEVIARDPEVKALYRLVEDKVYDLCARQAPVASDLRLLLTALHLAADIERMGALAVHVAKTTLRRHPARAIPEPLVATFEQMGATADRIAGKISTAISKLDVVAAGQLDRDDDAMDKLHTDLFGIMFAADWSEGTEAAVDGALLGRFYERYADHAVNAGHQVVFLVTGEALGSRDAAQ
ncbi:phosphate signaling complex protein PhoU [Dactylosporangium matsuzakiense]|uniref:Phosphate-specific transport system accessory protein PhoU n=1 Tax=Dactylosporangium matsuzakiense TaxID=53360 RepID=A0A9W6KF85_9ACTN|nr:phosphate signaling complex protein PhoU [Dactylosporangium matsuzakiense]UWZ45568.1 phosphate signaling complex protein PhoU [Dactylosporangium matsuzakiense]GLL00428.1 phosphate transport system regulatory protein PhoU [Dactylosporangium matsuzakiense]